MTRIRQYYLFVMLIMTVLFIRPFFYLPSDYQIDQSDKHQQIHSSLQYLAFPLCQDLGKDDVKMFEILFIIDARNISQWQRDVIRNEMKGYKFFFIGVQLDQYTPVALSQRVGNQFLWMKVHQFLQKSVFLLASSKWIVHMHANHNFQFDFLSGYLSRIKCEQATAISFPNDLQLSKDTSIVRTSNTVVEQIFGQVPLLLNRAASMAFTNYKSKLMKLTVIHDPDLVQDASFFPWSHKNNTKYIIQKSPRYSMVAIMEPPSQHHTTVVTAFFPLKSKHSIQEYHRWMRTMLSIMEPIIIFVAPNRIKWITKFRGGKANSTLIIPMNLIEVPLAKTFNASFWENQLAMDPEKVTHHSYELFWIWLSKTWWIQEAIRLNPFRSKIFMWCDIGSFRFTSDDRYENKWIVRYPSLIPRHSMLFMAHKPVAVQDDIWLSTKHWRYFFHSSSQAIGYSDTWKILHKEFEMSIYQFIRRGYFIGDDQVVMQHTCIRTSPLCFYVNKAEADDNPYFGLKYILHFGGDHQYITTPVLANLSDRGASYRINVNAKFTQFIKRVTSKA